jgi:hypothetical protein
MPVACLSIAALVAIALDAPGRAAVPLVAMALVAADLQLGVTLYRPTAADPGNHAYAVLRAAPAGRLLELPVYLPDRQEGSVYLYYAMQAPRERPAGYSTAAPRSADVVLRRLRRLWCDRSPTLDRAARGLGIRYVAAHGALPGCRADVASGRSLARDGQISVFALG